VTPHVHAVDHLIAKRESHVPQSEHEIVVEAALLLDALDQAACSAASALPLMTRQSDTRRLMYGRGGSRNSGCDRSAYTSVLGLMLSISRL
jgi:hypothetical protein